MGPGKVSIAFQNKKPWLKAYVCFARTIGSMNISRGQTISVFVSGSPRLNTKWQLREFERWLESQGRTPAEVSLKGRLRELLKSDITPAGSVAEPSERCEKQR